MCSDYYSPAIIQGIGVCVCVCGVFSVFWFGISHFLFWDFQFLKQFFFAGKIFGGSLEDLAFSVLTMAIAIYWPSSHPPFSTSMIWILEPLFLKWEWYESRISWANQSLLLWEIPMWNGSLAPLRSKH